METSFETIKHLAEELKIPTIDENRKIWFIRTQSGVFFNDFYYNNFVALGWDLIPASLMTDILINEKDKKKRIEELYPEESRPGLIYGHLNKFYNIMKSKDLVIIPSAGSKDVAIGVLQDITTEVSHVNSNEIDTQCEYTHIRGVKWIKRVDLRTDIYLAKILHAQQAVSNITSYSEFVYRNIYPCYLSSDGIHLTLKKNDTAEYKLKNNVELQYSVMKIYEALVGYLGIEDEEDLIVKTAVGSPGFIKFFAKSFAGSGAFALIFKFMLGEVETPEGESYKGVMGFLALLNKIFNDSETRANVRADTEYKKALTEKVKRETEAIKIENEYKRREYAAQQIMPNIQTIIGTTAESGITINMPLDNTGN